MRGSDARVYYAQDPDSDDPGILITNRCDVALESNGNECSAAIGELGEIFGSAEARLSGQAQYCDWACMNGEALVEALAACAL